METWDFACAALSATPVIAAVLSSLRPVERLRLATVSRAWARALDDDELWRDLTQNQLVRSLKHACRFGGVELVQKRVKVFGILRSDIVTVSGQSVIFEHIAFRDLDSARWLASHFSLTSYDIDDIWLNLALERACFECRVDIAQWLASTFNMATKHLKYKRMGDIIYSNIFIKACARPDSDSGQPSIVEWLITYFRLDLAYFRTECYESPLATACHNGQLGTVRSLTRLLGLTVEDVRHGQNQALISACARSLELAQWLVSHFELTADDVRAQNNRAFITACTNYGRWSTAQWLAETFNLTLEDASPDRNRYGAFRLLCSRGYLQNASGMALHFGLTPEYVRDSRALINACENGHEHIVEWLVEDFGVTADDIRSENCRAVYKAIQAQNYRLADWLINRFDLGVEEITRNCQHLDAAVNVWVKRRYACTVGARE